MPENQSDAKSPNLDGIDWFRRLPKAVFEQIALRVVNKESVYSIARWLEDLRPHGTENVSFNTWRRHLRVLRDSVESEVARQAHNALPSVAMSERVVAEFDEAKAELLSENDIDSDEIRKVVTKAVRNLKAIELLKYACVVQLERVDRLVAIEQKLKMNLQGGYKEIDVLRRIAAEIAKIEMGSALARLKRLDGLA